MLSFFTRDHPTVTIASRYLPNVKLLSSKIRRAEYGTDQAIRPAQRAAIRGNNRPSLEALRITTDGPMGGRSATRLGRAKEPNAK